MWRMMVSTFRSNANGLSNEFFFKNGTDKSLKEWELYGEIPIGMI